MPCGAAGLVGGMSHGRLILAGGNNFPGEPPWKGGRPAYYRDIWILDAKTPEWRMAEAPLPLALAYGCCGTFGDDIFVAGGANENGPTNRVFRLTTMGEDVAVEELSPLPFPVMHAATAVMKDGWFVAGGSSAAGTPSLHRFLVGRYRREQRDLVWDEISAWPGVGRQLAVA